ncbi:NAD(P)-binding protein [Polyplosphaeria fusca]|uniref:NAD(P)-binding protein n=1 Tax=Polyplosphaeria fusca TaxID=682080 RepID=A0A9P4R2F3_9PLEO|nr:NAD(P)-binding protein [Polyplosphaeria fusca]
MTQPAPVHLATKDLFRLDGRTILITGGAGAVGSTVACALLESGADVVLLDLPASPSAATTQLLEEAATTHGTRFQYHPLNVTHESAYPPLFTSLRPSLRHPLRGLVACAGISGEADACSYSMSDFRHILDVNVSGTFLAAQAVAQEMRRERVGGSMVFVASMSGSVSNRGLNTSAYNASKSALLQLARSLAAEWGHVQNTFPGNPVSETKPELGNGPREAFPPIRVNTLSPGHIETPISEGARARGLTGEWAGQNMLGRISRAEEFRGPVMFLLGEGASYMTGADLRVDGGHCAW